MTPALVKFQKRMVYTDITSDPLIGKVNDWLISLIGSYVWDAYDLESQKRMEEKINGWLKQELSTIQKVHFLKDDSKFYKIDYLEASVQINKFDSKENLYEIILTLTSDWYTILDSLGNKILVHKKTDKAIENEGFKETFFLTLPDDISFGAYKKP
ncbi:hypothetical protein SIO70_11805 [Chitinophaga sancti]|uniref:hypothetical protein n=1 Tax=Chitinophaga sancti TaxID=1004 RepID=UPI002A758BE2|nr:hypothetical protein [Chitinophaga sancti]WPQ65533.1 hypothetical protein SIO70_11805 [Chitinophaga sancti]